MPIQPPHATRYGKQPDAPEDPPSTHNVAQSTMYEFRVLTNAAHAPELNDDLEEAIADAATYKHAILATHIPAAAVAPAWFIPAVQEAVRREISDLKVMMSKNMNRQYGNGSVQPFEIVPFIVDEDGQIRLQDPTEDPHNLPHLRTLQDIRDLSAQNSANYFRHYFRQVPVPRTQAQRKQQIAIAIGVAIQDQ